MPLLSGNQLWTDWNGLHSASITNASVTTGNQTYTVVWQEWCTGATSSQAVIYYSNVWGGWLGNQTAVGGLQSSMNQVISAQQEVHVFTPEEQAATEQRLRDLEQRARSEEASRRAANSKALRLLEQNLTKEQRESLQKTRKFVVQTRDTKRSYVINYGRAGNVYLLNEAGLAVARFCIHPDMACPHEDTMLAQKLMLENDESEFLRIANRTNMHLAA